jgi:hypothetical protein
MTFERLLVSASRGLTDGETRALAVHTDLAKAVREYGSSFDATIEAFETQRSAARRHLLHAIEATALARLQQGVIPGSRFRKVHAAVVLHAMRTNRVALPAWVVTYRYRGKPYRVVVHGQNADVVLGHAPYSVAKIALLVLAVLAAVAIVFAIVVAVGASSRHG